MGITYADAPKQPYEEIPTYMDFEDRLPDGESIVAASVTGYGPDGVADATIVSDDSYSGTKVYFTYKGGVDGSTYKIRIQAKSATAKAEDDFVFAVKEY